MGKDKVNWPEVFSQPRDLVDDYIDVLVEKIRIKFETHSTWTYRDKIKARRWCLENILADSIKPGLWIKIK